MFHSPSLPSNDDLPEVSEYAPLDILHAVTDVYYRLISQLPYSKHKEKSKILSGSPSTFDLSVHFVFIWQYSPYFILQTRIVSL